MRHKVAGYKLSRTSEHRKSDRRNLAIALFTHGQITTTIPKAKSVQPFVEKLITTARKGDLAARRRLGKALGNPILVKDDTDTDVKRNKYGELVGGPRVLEKLISDIAPRFADRNGGYTRIVRLGTHRIGDGTDLCVLQLVGDEEGPQVSGQYSRRRQKANRRMEFAAQRRKGASATAEAAAAATEQPSESQPPDTPDTSATPETPDADTQADAEKPEA